VLEMGHKLGVPLLMTALFSQIVEAAYAKGYREKDTVAFIEVLRGLAGLAERPGIDDEPFGT